MDLTQIISIAAGTPSLAIVIWLLVKEQNTHEATRKARDDDNRMWLTKYSELAQASAIASERTAAAMERVEESLKDLITLTRSPVS